MYIGNAIEQQNINTLNLCVDTPEIAQLVSDFRRFAKKSAEGVLDMAATVYRARQLERQSEFVRFCELIGHNSTGSTIKKLLQIGEKYEFLLAKAEKLPGSWTTVYQISRLANEQIETLIDKGVIHSQMQSKELEVALDKPTRPKGIESKKLAAVQTGTQDLPDLGFRVRLSQELEHETLERLRAALSSLKTIQGVEVEVGATLDAFLSE